MKGERILVRKFEKLNRLKMNLVSRSEEDKEVILKEIIEVADDLEAILLDIGYMAEEKPVKEEYRTYRCFRDNEEFSRDDLGKYNGKEDMPLYIAIDGKVYDVTDTIKNREINELEDITEYYEKNKELLEYLTVVGTLIE